MTAAPHAPARDDRPELEHFADLRERVSARGNTVLAGRLPDGRQCFMFELRRPAADGTTHRLMVAPARGAR